MHSSWCSNSIVPLICFYKQQFIYITKQTFLHYFLLKKSKVCISFYGLYALILYNNEKVKVYCSCGWGHPPILWSNQYVVNVKIKLVTSVIYGHIKCLYVSKRFHENNECVYFFEFFDSFVRFVFLQFWWYMVVGLSQSEMMRYPGRLGIVGLR